MFDWVNYRDNYRTRRIKKKQVIFPLGGDLPLESTILRTILNRENDLENDFLGVDSRKP